ncbi:MAG: SDR family oxidoreductase [Nostocaceae cyanobacterium]|nr:SDR family oxidoreductase [Nostocaceae cyanobacterium]
MNIAIIGCGYVGYAAAEHWQHKMSLIVNVTTTSPQRIHELEAVAQKVVVVKGDDSEGLKNVLHNQDVVLLTIASKGGSSYEETYLKTAQTLVDVLQKNPGVKQLIYTSTCSVYGNQNGALVDEETPVNPISQNGQIIKETEQVLLGASNDKTHVCILRLGGIYGRNRELVKIYSRVAGKTRPGNGSEPANWIHLQDIVAAIEFARHYRLQGIYNLVDDANLTTKEVIENVCTKHNLAPVTWDETMISNKRYNARISNQKIKAAGYKFIHPQMIF